MTRGVATVSAVLTVGSSEVQMYRDWRRQVTLPGQGGTVYFNYDPFGRRIRKVFGSAGCIDVGN